MTCQTCSGTACSCRKAKFTILTPEQTRSSLVGSLTNTVDRLRDLYVRYGARTYQVFLVWTRWSGGERGLGVEQVIKTVPVLPTPDVSTLTAIQNSTEMIGTAESGDLYITQISPRYTEAELVGLAHFTRPGDPLPEDVSFYWEIFYPDTDGDGVRRRFTPRSAPNSDPTKFQWRIRLLRQAEDRATSGEIR